MIAIRRVIRAQRVMSEAAEVLDQIAIATFQCETIDGAWPASSIEALKYHDKCRSLAENLRKLCSGGGHDD